MSIETMKFTYAGIIFVTLAAFGGHYDGEESRDSK
jgi:hypothetical protein